VSIAAKFSLRNIILSMWHDIGLKTNLSCFIDIATDTKAATDCNFIGVYQLEDIQTQSQGHAFDIFVIRYFYSASTSFTEMDAEVAFGKLSEPFKKKIEGATYIHAGKTYFDDFEYISGSENKAGRQTTGSKLPFKQFTVYSPKTNIL
jgi:hypothetical protein